LNTFADKFQQSGLAFGESGMLFPMTFTKFLSQVQTGDRHLLGAGIRKTGWRVTALLG
jgi:hypothetical protein